MSYSETVPDMSARLMVHGHGMGRVCGPPLAHEREPHRKHRRAKLADVADHIDALSHCISFSEPDVEC